MSAPEIPPTERPELDPLIGTVLAGKFRMEQLLGAGAMGRVFRARQLTLDKPVAIKVLNPALASDPTFVARFAREAKAAARLDHPNSIRVFDFGQEPNGVFFIAMELVDGNDLATEIEQQGPLPPDRIAHVLGQVLAALSVAHEMGVLHRDLKPANVMLVRRKNDDGQSVDLAKVCDFGIAKIVDSSSGASGEREGTRPLTQGLVIGTPEYMAPEQARGGEVDARADLYAVGVILYQMLTGRLPFEGDTPLQMVIKHVTEQPARPSAIRPDVDPRLEAVCLKAMEKNPADRFQTAAEMRLALAAAVPRAWVSSPPSGPAASHSLPPTMTASAIVATGAGATGAGAAHLEPTRDTREESRQPTLGGVTPGKQAQGSAHAGRHGALWLKVTVPAAALLASIAVFARVRHPHPETPQPPPSPALQQSVGAAATQPSVVSAPLPSAPVALAPVATEPTTNPAPAPESARPPAASPRPARARAANVEEPSTKVAAATGLAPASAQSEIPAAVLETPPPVAPAPLPSPPVAPPAPVIASPTPAVEPPPAAPASPRFDPSSARVLVQSATHVAGATTSSMNRALGGAAPQLTACYRSALPQLAGPVEGEATLHVETDGAGTINEARVAGPLGQVVQRCATAALVGRRVANVDTGSASADIPLVFKAR